MLCGGVFIDMKLSNGDASACHYYSFFHQLVQDAFVFITIQTPKSLVTICIDDSTIVVPQECKQVRLTPIHKLRVCVVQECKVSG